ncbi:MAG TPA: hypothetical protein V6C81_04390 [Planktothrix sp.]|jgi:hypothetical protein
MAVEQINPAQLTKDVDSAIKSHDFSQVFKELQSAEKGKGPQEQAKDLAQYRQLINQELKSHGFPDMQLDLKMDPTGLHVLDSKGKDIDQQHFAEKSAAPQKVENHTGTPAEKGSTPAEQSKEAPHAPKVQSAESQKYWQDHERKNNADGSSDVKVKQGDSLWKIAEHATEERLGHKIDPKNLKDMQAVLKTTKELAAAQKPPLEIKNGKAMIRPGDSIHIPASKGDQTGKPGEQNHPGEKPGEQHQPGDPNHPDNKSQENPHAGHKGKVETKGDTSTVTYPDGHQTSVKNDSKGEPSEVTYEQNGNKLHYKKTGDHEWTDDQGQKMHGDIKMGKDGTVTVTDNDHHTNYTKHKDGSGVTTDDKGQTTRVETADGPHKTTFTKDGDGKFNSNPGTEKYDDVQLGADGTVTAKMGGGKKVMYPDGAQVDTDEKGKTTYVQTPDGAHQHSFSRQTDGSYKESPQGQKFDDVTMGDDGTVTAKMGGGNKKYMENGSQVDTDEHGKTTFIQSPDGPHQKSFTKDGDGKFVSNPGKEKFDDVTMDGDGNVTAKMGGGKKEMNADGSQVDTDEKGNVTFAQSPDGAHQEAFTKDKSGKWHDATGASYDDVKVDDDGNITAKDWRGSHEHFANGSEVDKDSKGRPTRLHSANGDDVQMYYMTDSDSEKTPYSVHTSDGTWYYRQGDNNSSTYKSGSTTARIHTTGDSVTVETASGTTKVEAGDDDQ